MGKTPGKWIKTLLLGKKSPKLNLANGSRTVGTAKKEELMVSVRDDFSNLSVNPPVVASQPDPVITTAQNVVAPENGDESSVNLESSNDVEELELQQAAVKVQATFRAHQARRAFRTLKGIIRLQAVIRGYLVRRQAVATYSCIWGIVKFQALVRGQRARSSENGIQFERKHAEADDSEALQLSTYSWMDNPTRVLIVDKLLASSPTALPLKIQYGPEEPNSAKVWLERWTQLQVWSPGSRAARIVIPKSNTRKRNYEAVAETEKAKPKRGVKKQSEVNGSKRSTTESEKLKRNVRKVSRVSKEPLKTDIDKAKHNSSKSRSTSKKTSPFEVKDEKLNKSSAKRSSLSNGSQKATHKSVEKKKDIGDTVQIEPEEKVSDVLEGGDVVKSAEKATRKTAEKKKDIGESMQIEPEVKVSDVKSAGKATREEDTLLSPKRSSLSNGSQKATRKRAEKKKDIGDSVQIKPEVKVSNVLEGGDVVESAEKATSKPAEKKKDIGDSVQIEPEVKVSDVVEGGDVVESAEKATHKEEPLLSLKRSSLSNGSQKDTGKSAEKKKDIGDSVLAEPEVKVSDVLGGDVETTEKEKDTTDIVVSEEFDVEKEDNPQEEVEPRAVETSDKGEDLKCSDVVKVTSDNANVASDKKPSQRRVSLSPKIDNHDDGNSHSGRRIPSYMAPTASAKARLKGEGSPRFTPEKNGALRRHSLPSPANGKVSTTAVSPSAHKILVASTKGTTSGDKSFTSSRDISDKSARWKR